MTEPLYGHVYDHIDRPMMQKFIPDSAQRILDVGCNTGGFGAGLKARRSIEVWGVEPNRLAAERATQFLDRVIIEPFARNVSVPDRHFDAVVFNDVLEHLPDPWDALKLAATKLRPGGRVVASIPNLLHINNLLHMLRDEDFHYELTGIRDRTHLRFFTRRSAIRLFEESGLQIRGVEGINEEWWTPSLRRRLAYRFFGRKLENTKYVQFAIVATCGEHASTI